MSKDFARDGKEIVEIELRDAFIKAAQNIDDPSLDVLKLVISENGGTFLTSAEAIIGIDNALSDTEKQDKLSLKEKAQVGFVRAIFSAVSIISNLADKYDMPDTVYASVDKADQTKLVDALNNDSRVQHIVLKVDS